jgi:hypothetical protein
MSNNLIVTRLYDGIAVGTTHGEGFFFENFINAVNKAEAIRGKRFTSRILEKIADLKIGESYFVKIS